MAQTVTRLALRNRIRELGEIREGYLSDSRVNEEINQSLKALYDIIVDASPDYYESTQSISVVADTASYALPSDYYKTLGVDVQRADNSTYINLRRYNHAERNKYTAYGGRGINREWTEYRVRGSNIIFTPTPTWSGTVLQFYIPVCPTLSDDGDTFDGINGWDDFVVYDVLVKIIGGTEEGDASTWERLKGEAGMRIMRMADVRDVGEPDTIRDIDEEEAERMWPRYGTPP